MNTNSLSLRFIIIFIIDVLFSFTFLLLIENKLNFSISFCVYTLKGSSIKSIPLQRYIKIENFDIKWLSCGMQFDINNNLIWFSWPKWIQSVQNLFIFWFFPFNSIKAHKIACHNVMKLQLTIEPIKCLFWEWWCGIILWTLFLYSKNKFQINRWNRTIFSLTI